MSRACFLIGWRYHHLFRLYFGNHFLINQDLSWQCRIFLFSNHQTLCCSQHPDIARKNHFCQFQLFFEPFKKVSWALSMETMAQRDMLHVTCIIYWKLGSGIIFKMMLNSMKLVIICSAFCIAACFNSNRQSIPSIFSRSSVHFINKAWAEYESRSLLPISLSRSWRFFISVALLHGLLWTFELKPIGCLSQPIRELYSHQDFENLPENEWSQAFFAISCDTLI